MMRLQTRVVARHTYSVAPDDAAISAPHRIALELTLKDGVYTRFQWQSLSCEPSWWSEHADKSEYNEEAVSAVSVNMNWVPVLFLNNTGIECCILFNLTNSWNIPWGVQNAPSFSCAYRTNPHSFNKRKMSSIFHERRSPLSSVFFTGIVHKRLLNSGSFEKNIRLAMILTKAPVYNPPDYPPLHRLLKEPTQMCWNLCFIPYV